MALAYLPPDKIQEGLTFLKTEIDRLVLNWKRLDKWAKMFTYFEKEWMKIVGPKNFTVFNALDRTDNNAESYHRDINRDMGSKPDCPEFVGMKLLRCFCYCYLNFIDEFGKVGANIYSIRYIPLILGQNDFFLGFAI